MINEQLLEKFGAIKKTYLKNEMLFLENTAAKHYYQIESGIVKMNNFNDDGKEFIQGVFYNTQSFGEPPLFIDVTYPANAQALTDVVVFVLPKENFYKLLYAEQSIHLAFTKNLAKRLYYKAIIASEISSQEPEHRVLRFFDYLKDEHATTTATFSYKIPYTRQQIADTLGLRVETVIRVIKRLEKKQDVKIINRKVFR